MVILGASFDSIEANRAFAEKYGFPFQLICDVDRKMGVAYGAAENAESKHAARIAYLIGADGKIEKAFGKVNPTAFPAEAWEAVTAGK